MKVILIRVVRASFIEMILEKEAGEQIFGGKASRKKEKALLKP